MLDWQLCQICYPLEMKLLLTDLRGGGEFGLISVLRPNNTF